MIRPNFSGKFAYVRIRARNYCCQFHARRLRWRRRGDRPSQGLSRNGRRGFGGMRLLRPQIRLERKSKRGAREGRIGALSSTAAKKTKAPPKGEAAQEKREIKKGDHLYL